MDDKRIGGENYNKERKFGIYNEELNKSNGEASGRISLKGKFIYIKYLKIKYVQFQ